MTNNQACVELRALTYDMCNFSRSIDSMADKGLNAPDLINAMRLNVEAQAKCLDVLVAPVITFNDISE
jgi:hypothetical protein